MKINIFKFISRMKLSKVGNLIGFIIIAGLVLFSYYDFLYKRVYCEGICKGNWYGIVVCLIFVPIIPFSVNFFVKTTPPIDFKSFPALKSTKNYLSWFYVVSLIFCSSFLYPPYISLSIFGLISAVLSLICRYHLGKLKNDFIYLIRWVALLYIVFAIYRTVLFMPLLLFAITDSHVFDLILRCLALALFASIFIGGCIKVIMLTYSPEIEQVFPKSERRISFVNIFIVIFLSIISAACVI